MTSIDELVQDNARYVPGPTPSKRPRLRVAVLTCMDTRIDPFSAFGIEVGDAHVLRNAGGLPTDDVLRSVAISQRALGTEEIMLIQHTDCGMLNFDDAAFRAELAEAGAVPPWDVPGFADVTDSVRRSMDVVRECPWLPQRDAVRGFVFDVRTGRLDEVDT